MATAAPSVFAALALSCAGCVMFCDIAGGAMNHGIRGGGSCVWRTKDGGKPCRDMKECEYACWEGYEDYKPVGGRCAEWPIRFGCHAEVHDGVAGDNICVD